jgi:uncharacterized protein (TIGR03067 family)
MRLGYSFLFSMTAFFVVSGMAFIQGQPGSPANKKAVPNEIEGDWSHIFTEETAGVTPSYLNTGSRWFPVTHAYVWRISNGNIRAGCPTTNDDTRWTYYTYQKDARKKPRTIDLTFIGKKERSESVRSNAIYLVKDDWLFLCDVTQPDDKNTRPNDFKAAKEGETLSVYRRGVLPPLESAVSNSEMQQLCLRQITSEKKQDGANAIEGTWIEFIREFGGGPAFVIPQKSKNPKPVKAEDHFVKRVWKVSKDMVEKGNDDDTFPSKDQRWRYKVDPDAKPPTIDAILVDKTGKEYPQYQWKAIYEIIGHNMLICVNSSDPPVRPERFTTSAKTGGTTLYILRRAK